jgi:hypothetical protein
MIAGRRLKARVLRLCFQRDRLHLTARRPLRNGPLQPQEWLHLAAPFAVSLALSSASAQLARASGRGAGSKTFEGRRKSVPQFLPRVAGGACLRGDPRVSKSKDRGGTPIWRVSASTAFSSASRLRFWRCSMCSWLERSTVTWRTIAEGLAEIREELRGGRADIRRELRGARSDLRAESREALSAMASAVATSNQILDRLARGQRLGPAQQPLGPTRT